MKHVSARELRSLLHDGAELALVDVREAGQYGEGHLLFAVPLPYSRLELDAASLIPRRSTRIVLCDAGTVDVAERAARRLAAIGYTDIAVLEGGTQGWAAAGHALFAGVNVPSKLFGELVEHAYRTPRITPRELMRLKQAGADFILLDGRPLHEHHRMTIPGSTCCPNAELPYRIASIVTDPTTPIIVNCAGRTRSIIGAQTLLNFGIPNPVYALENGTQGWVLSDYALEYGSSRRYPERVDATTLPAQQEKARRLMDRAGIETVDARTVASWLGAPDRTTYLCDIRTPEEFAAGSLRGAVHAPGGQLVQATDQWIGVRNARVVLVDGGELVRAPVVASWLKQLGYDAYVLEDGVASRLEGIAPRAPALPRLEPIAAADLHASLATAAPAVFDLGPSMRFRKSHIPGSCWSIRPRLVADLAGATHAPVLVADDPDLARVAAIDLHEAGITDARVLAGGLAAWTQAGYATAASPESPPDADCIDFLFFVHDRHAGNREAMKRYLEWETGLIARLDAQERALFRLEPAAAASAPHT